MSRTFIRQKTEHVLRYYMNLTSNSAMANRIAIEKQILFKQKESSTVGLGMTPDERKLNKGIIEEIKKVSEHSFYFSFLILF